MITARQAAHSILDGLQSAGIATVERSTGRVPWRSGTRDQREAGEIGRRVGSATPSFDPPPARPDAREDDENSSPYRRIAADLRGAIFLGALGPGAALPTVVDLARRYGVAVGTAHRAISVLATDGLIEVARGRRRKSRPQRPRRHRDSRRRRWRSPVRVADTDEVSAREKSVQFESKTDAQGCWTTLDGRWKAKDHRVKGRPRAVTLTDTTRRATFGDTGASWTRLASWNAVRDMITAHG